MNKRWQSLILIRKKLLNLKKTQEVKAMKKFKEIFNVIMTVAVTIIPLYLIIGF